jgi:quercetin dioxygenase-like cupin family protein
LALAGLFFSDGGIDLPVNGVYLFGKANLPQEGAMLQQAVDVQVNPSEETIRIGPLAVRFLITGENSNASISAFELTVPAGQRLPGPAHSHDHYEETIYGIDGVLT